MYCTSGMRDCKYRHPHGGCERPQAECPYRGDFDAGMRNRRLLDSMQEPFHSAPIASDGLFDGGEPYTDEELALINGQHAAEDEETAFYRGHEHHPNRRAAIEPL